MVRRFCGIVALSSVSDPFLSDQSPQAHVGPFHGADFGSDCFDQDPPACLENYLVGRMTPYQSNNQLLLVLLAATIMLGRSSGYRSQDLYRFRAMARCTRPFDN